jgi:hypothetical protein
MRRVIVLVAAIALAGCAQQTVPPVSSVPPPVPVVSVPLAPPVRVGLQPAAPAISSASLAPATTRCNIPSLGIVGYMRSPGACAAVKGQVVP